jgi:hypothetical protein
MTVKLRTFGITRKMIQIVKMFFIWLLTRLPIVLMTRVSIVASLIATFLTRVNQFTLPAKMYKGRVNMFTLPVTMFMGRVSKEVLLFQCALLLDSLPLFPVVTNLPTSRPSGSFAGT